MSEHSWDPPLAHAVWRAASAVCIRAACCCRAVCSPLQLSRKGVCARQSPPDHISACEHECTRLFAINWPPPPPQPPLPFAACPAGHTGHGPIQMACRKFATGLRSGFRKGCRRNERKPLFWGAAFAASPRDAVDVPTPATCELERDEEELEERDEPEEWEEEDEPLPPELWPPEDPPEDPADEEPPP